MEQLPGEKRGLEWRWTNFQEEKKMLRVGMDQLPAGQNCLEWRGTNFFSNWTPVSGNYAVANWGLTQV